MGNILYAASEDTKTIQYLKGTARKPENDLVPEHVVTEQREMASD